MTSQVIFYRAGCPVGVATERQVAAAIDSARFDSEIVHLGDAPSRIEEAESVGVQSVPALVIEGPPFHLELGAAITRLILEDPPVSAASTDDCTNHEDQTGASVHR